MFPFCQGKPLVDLFLANLPDIKSYFDGSPQRSKPSGLYSLPQSLRSIVTIPYSKSYADRATCHQKAAATAAKMESSGTIQADPSETPVQPAPAKAASNPSGLRMTRDWSPDQLQLQAAPQRR